jgi:ketosteroid isomerase-like protein
MRARPGLLALVVLPCLAACANKGAERVDSTTAPAAAAAPGAAVSTKADDDSIKAIGDRWKQMLAAHDSVGIGNLFAPDGGEYPPNEPAAKGPTAVAKSWAGLFKLGKDVKLDFNESDRVVAQSGDLAVERGTYTLTWTDPKGKAMKDHGNYVTAFRKVNGQWKVLADINASEVPMPGM